MHTYQHIHDPIRKNGREGLVFPVVGRVGHLSRQSRNTSGTHTSTYTAAILTHTNTHTNTHTRTYAHIQTHIQTRIQTHMQTHIHAHMHTYKHMHAAIRKNGWEGLVFPVLGRVRHLVIMIMIMITGHFYSATLSIIHDCLRVYHSEALPTTARILNRSFTPKCIGKCKLRTCPKSLRSG